MKAIVIFLKKIENVRKKYVAHHKKFRPHITLVYPFKAGKKIDKQIEEKIKSIKSFDISLEGLGKSKKNLPYLVVDFY